MQSSSSSGSSTHSDWKAVGSPPRQGVSGVQGGMLQQQQPNNIGLSSNNTTAATATPDHHHTSMSWLQQDYAFPPVRRNSAVSSSASTAAAAAAPPWANAMTLPTPSSSISTSSGAALFDHHHRRRSSIATPNDYPDIASVPMLPEVSTEPYFREYRSMSFSIDASNDRDEIPPPHHQHHPRFPSHQQLGTMHEEEDDIEEEELLMSAAMDDEMLAQAQLRARSKSSAAAFNIWHPSHATEDTRSWMRFTQRRSSVAHAAPTPSYHPSIYSPLPAPSSSLLSNGDRERLAGLRRFSLSPMPEGRLQQSPIIPTTDPRYIYIYIYIHHLHLIHFFLLVHLPILVNAVIHSPLPYHKAIPTPQQRHPTLIAYWKACKRYEHMTTTLLRLCQFQHQMIFQLSSHQKTWVKVHFYRTLARMHYFAWSNSNGVDRICILLQ